MGTREHPHGDYEGRAGSTEQLGGSVDRGQVSTRKVARHRATEIGSRGGGKRVCCEDQTSALQSITRRAKLGHADDALCEHDQRRICEQLLNVVLGL